MLILRCGAVLCGGGFSHARFSAGTDARLCDFLLWERRYFSYIGLLTSSPGECVLGLRKWCRAGPVSLCGDHTQRPFLFQISHLAFMTYTCKKTVLKIKARFVPESPLHLRRPPLPFQMMNLWLKKHPPFFQEARVVPLSSLLLRNHSFQNENVQFLGHIDFCRQPGPRLLVNESFEGILQKDISALCLIVPLTLILE